MKAGKEEVQYLTEKEVSQITKMALPTLRIGRQNGKGFSYVKVGGTSVRYKLGDILQFMEQGRVALSSAAKGKR